MRYIVLLIASLFLLYPATIYADVLVLVHGYLASPSTWESSNINNLLDHHGWKRGGIFTYTPYGVQLLEAESKHATNTVYIVDLPAEAPLVVQSDFFISMLDTIRQRQPGEPLVIAGHSAGGVVARLSLIRGNTSNVEALITIASPHIGTTRAEQALNITHESGPLGIVKNIFGGSDYDTLKRSRGLLYDLARPHPGNLLYWLNSQQHPDIKYISVVRLNPAGMAGDELVPGYSQDMNNVPALHGKASVVTTPAGHVLVPQDANTLIYILDSLSS